MQKQWRRAHLPEFVAFFDQLAMPRGKPLRHTESFVERIGNRRNVFIDGIAHIRYRIRQRILEVFVHSAAKALVRHVRH